MICKTLHLCLDLFCCKPAYFRLSNEQQMSYSCRKHNVQCLKHLPGFESFEEMVAECLTRLKIDQFNQSSHEMRRWFWWCFCLLLIKTFPAHYPSCEEKRNSNVHPFFLCVPMSSFICIIIQYPQVPTIEKHLHQETFLLEYCCLVINTTHLKKKP